MSTVKYCFVGVYSKIENVHGNSAYEFQARLALTVVSEAAFTAGPIRHGESWRSGGRSESGAETDLPANLQHAKQQARLLTTLPE